MNFYKNIKNYKIGIVYLMGVVGNLFLKNILVILFVFIIY